MTILVSTFDCGRDINDIPHFTGSEIFYVHDVFDISYLRDVFKARGRPAAVMSDVVLQLYDHLKLGIEYHGLPFWTMQNCRQWSAQDFDDARNITCEHVFNFMINKKQCSRFLLMKLVEIGGYSNFQYTWSGVGRHFDMVHVIKELDELPPGHILSRDQFRSAILSPIEMPDRFIESRPSDQISNGSKIDEMAYRPYSGNTKHTWNDFLAKMFNQSCVSLISETGNYSRLATITEKSLYAFFGLTFPIWVGNYGQAKACEQLGLDVFDDVIDHRYQWYPTLIERCYWAFELNKKILHDLAFAHDMRQRHRDRLLANRKFLLNDGLGDYCQSQISAMPCQYQDAAQSVKTKFDLIRSDRKTQFNSR